MQLTRASAVLLATLTIPTAYADPEIGTPEFQAQSAETKRDAVWTQIAAEPYTGDLPTKGVIGAAAKLIWSRLTLKPTFDDQGDVRPDRSKTFHRWGTAVKVRFVPEREGMAQRLPGAEAANVGGYTGVFATGAVGIARLSLGLGNLDALWAPGIGLKLFVDGKPSVNVHAIPRDGAQKSKDFLAPALSSEIDPTPLDGFLKFSSKANPNLRTVKHLAMVEADGTAVAEPKAPHHVAFRAPAGIAFSAPPAWGQEDFRTSLAKIPAGTTLYEVWAYDATGTEGGTKIGTLVTESAFVASSFEDRRLHFHHADESRLQKQD